MPRAMEGPISLLPDPKRKIMAFLLDEPQTAVRIAERLGVFESAVRQHLQGLESEGFVKPSFEQRGLGRPKKIYEITPDGAELFSKAYDDILIRLLAETTEAHGAKASENLMLAVARKIAKEFPPAHAAKQRVAEVSEALDKIGFASRVDETPAGQSIMSKSCPFFKLAQANRELICAKFHSEIIHAGLGQKGIKVELKECMVDGKPFCRHLIEKSS